MNEVEAIIEDLKDIQDRLLDETDTQNNAPCLVRCQQLMDQLLAQLTAHANGDRLG